VIRNTFVLNPFKKSPTPKDLTMRQVLSATKKGGLPTWQQWQQLPKILSAAERRILIFALSASLASLASLATWYIATHRVDIPAVGGEYVEALIGEPQFINPLYATQSDVDQDLTKLVYSGLLKWDPGQGLVNDLASEVTVSEDGKTYTVKIRDDAKFHNGEEVRARDIIFTIDAIQNPQYRSPLAVSFRGVTVSQVDDKTVAFTLEEPFAPFLSTLTVGILPAGIWGEIEPRNALLASRNLEPIGSGPYRFEEFAKDRSGNILSYTLERNPAYYASPALIERLIFKFYPSAAEAVRALENRNVEGVSFIPADLETEVDGARSVVLWRPSLPREVALYFNQSTSEVLKDKAVRTAIAQAIDKSQLVTEVLGGHGLAIDAPILPGMLGEHPEVAKIAYDPAAAAAALETAGYKLAEGATVRTLKKEPEGEAPNELTVTITTAQNPEFVRTAEIIAARLSAVGIKAEVRTVPAEEFFTSTIEPKDYEVLLTGTLLGLDPDPYPFWHSSQNRPGGLNLALYANRNADALLEAARKSTNSEERAQKYREFQDLIAADVPAVFLYQSSYAYAVADKIRNVTLERLVSPSDRFANVVEWYIKTRKALR
jgi:peptide/nickel transport system substrate-binding protein